MRLTEQEYFSLLHRHGAPTIPVVSPPIPQIKPSKYHNILTECDGMTFQSKKEARYYRELLCRVHAGEVSYFHWQFPIRLKGGVVYKVDFLEVWTDGSLHYIDVKGHKTAMYKVKKKLVEAEYPIRIEEA